VSHEALLNDDPGSLEKGADALTQVLVEVGLLADTVNVGAVGRPVVGGLDPAAEEQARYSAIPPA
jgi:hypothetical protein